MNFEPVLRDAAAVAKAPAGRGQRRSAPPPAAPTAAAAQPRAAVPDPAAQVSVPAPVPARGVRQRWEPAPPRRVLQHITLDDRWAGSKGHRYL
jgi:hypothetical protein